MYICMKTNVKETGMLIESKASQVRAFLQLFDPAHINPVDYVNKLIWHLS